MIITIGKQLPRKMVRVAQLFGGEEGVAELYSDTEKWLRMTALERGKPIGSPWRKKGWCMQKVEVEEEEDGDK